MNKNQKDHLAYGKELLSLKNRVLDDSYKYGGNTDKIFGRKIIESKLNIDPVTQRQVLRPVQAACIWAAEDDERAQRFASRYPGVPTIRGLHRLYQSGDTTSPSVYVYRMKSPISGQLIEPGICKIGSTEGNAEARIREQSRKAGIGYIPEIQHEFKCSTPKKLEHMLHK